MSKELWPTGEAEENNLTANLYPVKKGAERLGISVWTLRKKAYEGEVVSVKIGAKLLIPESEIERLVREGTRQGLVTSERTFSSPGT